MRREPVVNAWLAWAALYACVIVSAIGPGYWIGALLVGGVLLGVCAKAR